MIEKVFALVLFYGGLILFSIGVFKTNEILGFISCGLIGIVLGLMVMWNKTHSDKDTKPNSPR